MSYEVIKCAIDGLWERLEILPSRTWVMQVGDLSHLRRKEAQGVPGQFSASDVGEWGDKMRPMCLLPSRKIFSPKAAHLEKV